MAWTISITIVMTVTIILEMDAVCYDCLKSAMNALEELTPILTLVLKYVEMVLIMVGMNEMMATLSMATAVMTNVR